MIQHIHTYIFITFFLRLQINWKGYEARTRWLLIAKNIFDPPKIKRCQVSYAHPHLYAAKWKYHIYYAEKIRTSAL